MDENIIEAETVGGGPEMPPNTQVVMRDPATAPPPPPKVTAAQAKVEAVASLTMKAYERAATLEMTPEEIAGLAKEFPDTAIHYGAAGKENLLYIQHAALRERLNQVFSPGKWAIIPRSRWAEEFEYWDDRAKKNAKGYIVYVEAMLLVKGAFAGEAIGDMTYLSSNKATNYGDAVEGAKSAALRRCVKELGCGLQVYRKEWCEEFTRRHPPAKSERQQGASAPAPAAKAAPAPAPAPAKAPVVAKAPPVTEAEKAANIAKAWKVRFLAAFASREEQICAWKWAVATEALRADQPLPLVDAMKLPQTLTGETKLLAAIRDEAKGPLDESVAILFDEAHKTEAPPGSSATEMPPEAASAPETSFDPIKDWWRKISIPTWSKDYKEGKRTFGELPKNKLWWWCCKWEPTGYQGQPPSAADQNLRDELDKVKKVYDFDTRD